MCAVPPVGDGTAIVFTIASEPKPRPAVTRSPYMRVRRFGSLFHCAKTCRALIRSITRSPIGKVHA
jgi:hypothetical protein